MFIRLILVSILSSLAVGRDDPAADIVSRCASQAFSIILGNPITDMIDCTHLTPEQLEKLDERVEMGIRRSPAMITALDLEGNDLKMGKTRGERKAIRNRIIEKVMELSSKFI